MSATESTYAVPAVLAARRERSPSMLLAAVLVGALVLAMLWFVARPAFTMPSASGRSCAQVTVAPSGAVTCVTKNDRVIHVR